MGMPHARWGKRQVIRRHGTELRAAMMLADVAFTALLAITLSTLMFPGERARFWADALPQPAFALAMFVSAWVLTLWLHGAYRLRARWSITSEARVILRALALFTLVSFSFLYLAKMPDVSRGYMIVLLSALLTGAVAVRLMMRWAFQRARRRGRNMRSLLVLGTGSMGRTFAGKLSEHPELGLRIVGFLGEPTDELPERWPYLGTVDQLPDLIHNSVVDEVAICLVTDDWALIESVAALCESEGKIVRMPVPMPRLSIATSHVEDLDGTPVVSLLTGPRSALALGGKRMIDVAGGALGLMLLTPLLCGIAIAVILTDGRPVLFRQERVGLNGRRFQIFKFRSMVKDADAQLEGLRELNEIKGQAFKLSLDPRVTTVGRFLRRSSLDELPQLLNVLRGEMSLVGPRPPLPTEVHAYDAWHRRRLSMKPGMTGLWQIEGRNESEFDHWVKKDLEYIDRWSTWLDIVIILRTIPAMLRTEGR
jgi:exopolysaccharide biosynthesis polyprenyl glycosylphosphotransferase